MLAVELHVLAAPHLPADLDDFAGAAERSVERNAVETLNHLRPGRADAQPEAAVGHVVQPRGRHRQQRRGADVDGDDAGAELDPRRLRREIAQLADRVEGVGLRHQGDVDADLLQLDDLVDGFEKAAGVVQKDSGPHRSRHLSGCQQCDDLVLQVNRIVCEGIHHRRLGQCRLGVGEVAVGLVAGQRVQQVAGQQRPHHLLGAAVGARQPDHPGQSAPLDQPAGLRPCSTMPQRRSRPRRRASSTALDAQRHADRRGR